MRITNSFASFFVLLVSTTDFAQAECYKSGIGWGDRSAAYWHAGRACRGYDGIAGVFQGSYAPGQIKRGCVDFGDMKFEFGVRSKNDFNSDVIDPEYCYRRLSDEINCDLGGSNTKDNWEVL
jgi:hypothetical protein